MGIEAMQSGGSMKDRLLEKLSERSACIGVVGLGYVGLPLALEFARAGFHVIGYDVSQRVAHALARAVHRLAAAEEAKVKARELTDGYDETGALSEPAPFVEGNGLRLFADAANGAVLTRLADASTDPAAYLGAHLARGGHDVTMVDAVAEHL